MPRRSSGEFMVSWDEWVGMDRLMKHTEENVLKQQALDKKTGVDKNAKSGCSSQVKPKSSSNSKLDNEETTNNGMLFFCSYQFTFLYIFSYYFLYPVEDELDYFETRQFSKCFRDLDNKPLSQWIEEIQTPNSVLVKHQVSSMWEALSYMKDVGQEESNGRSFES